MPAWSRVLGRTVGTWLIMLPTVESGVDAIRLDAVAQRFGRRWVLRGVTLRVMPGEVVALTGRNGSGKTTLLRILATAIRPTRGEARVFGNDVVAAADAVREQVGLLGHTAGLYDDLTALENLDFASRMAGERSARAKLEGVLDQVSLLHEADERVRGFSAGMRRRLALARLLLRPPRLLLLDEPFASFDVDGIARVHTFSREVARRGGSVLLATHDLERGRGLFDRRIHIAEGRAADRDLDSELVGVLDSPALGSP